MASITKCSTGYRAQVYVRGVRDSETFRKKSDAVDWAARRETELRASADMEPGDRITLREALKRYSDEVSPTKLGVRWEQLRLGLFARSDHLPLSTPISKVTPEQIAVWRDERIKTVTGSSVVRELTLLSAVCEHARTEWRWIKINPVGDVRRPAMPDHREVVITPGQIRRMLRAMKFPWRRRPSSVGQSAAVLFVVALRTGMRAGELCGLTWDRVYADYCTTPHKLGKTRASLRSVPLEPKARALIEQMRGWDEVKVFGIESASLDALFRRYRTRAGLSGFTFHDSRHTAATWLARRLDILDLCKMFGWSDMKQALTYYNPTASAIAKRISDQWPGKLPHR
jgi:integrase